MKRCIIAFLLVLLLIPTSLFAGGKGEERPEVEAVDIEKDASKMGNVEIRTFIKADQKWNEIVDELVGEFQGMYPNLRIKEESITGELDSKLIVMHASGTAPDIHTVSPAGILPFLRAGALMPLDGYIAASDVLDQEDLWNVNQLAYRYDGTNFGSGELYGLIKDWSPDFMMFYNKDLFDKAGVDYPSATEAMSWKEYQRMLEKLVVKDDSGKYSQYSTVFDFVPIQQLYQFILTNGGSVFNEDGTKATLTAPKTKEAIRYWVDLMIGPNAVAPYFEEPQNMWAGDLFKTGKSAVTFFGRWAIPGIFADQPSLDFGLAPPPVPEGGERVSTIAGAIGWVMSSTTPNPDASWKFLEYLMTDGQEKLAKIGFNIPGNKSVAEAVFATEKEPQQKAWNDFFLNEATNYTVPFPMSGYVSSAFVENAISEGLRGYFLGEISLDVAIKQAEDLINAEIADWL